MANAARVAAKPHSMLLYLLEKKQITFKKQVLVREASVNTQQHVPDILSVFTSTEGSECQSLVFPGCTVFFEDVKQKYMLNRSKQLLITHALLSFHFYPIFLLGLLAKSPLSALKFSII